jgi:hypothetical protein
VTSDITAEAAREAVAARVVRQAAAEPTFRGAFPTGSVTALPSGAPLPRTSDVDVTVLGDVAARFDETALPLGAMDGDIAEQSGRARATPHRFRAPPTSRPWPDRSRSTAAALSWTAATTARRCVLDRRDGRPVARPR